MILVFPSNVYLFSISSLIFIILFICLYLYFCRVNRKQESEILIPEEQLPSQNIQEIFSLDELPSNYKTFDLTKKSHHYLSSDSSYTNSINGQSYPFGTIKSKSRPRHSTSSESEEFDNEPMNPIIPSLMEYFRIELIYKLYYLSDEKQLIFEILRLIPMQNLIDQCFSSFVCKIRLFLNNDKDKHQKYLSKKNPINDLFQFELEENKLEKSYLKLHLLGYHHQNNKRIEIGQTVLVINQYKHLNNQLEQYTKSIQIYEERIDMIIRQQAKTENEARALISLVYENDRCLLHIGLIKILGIQYLLKQPLSHFQNRDQIQIKICTILDGKIIEKRKSPLIPILKGTCSFSTSFHFDYISLHKTSISIQISYRRSLISPHNKPVSIIEFGSTQLKNQQTFQHWTDTLSTPNQPHVHWHRLEPISNEN